MTYSFGGFSEDALRDLNGLPGELVTGLLLERVIELLDAPWDAAADLGHPNRRNAAFAGGRGLLSFDVDEEKQVLRFVRIVWLG